jgi:hypothetical protein
MLGRNTGRQQRMLKEIMKDHIEPVFERNAFSQNGDLFFKVAPGMVKAADLEYFRFNTAVFFGYWFNIRLFGGAFSGKKKTSLKSLLREGTELYRKRIGVLWDEEHHMYQITGTTDPKQLTQKMLDDVNRHLLPFLDRFRELDEAARFLAAQGSETGSSDYAYVLALMYAKSGQKPESQRFFTQSLQRAGTPEIAAAIRQTARFYGVDLDST